MSNDPDLLDLDPDPPICKTCDGEGFTVAVADPEDEATCFDCLGEGVIDQ